jgi:hypothetical protein
MSQGSNGTDRVERLIETELQGKRDPVPMAVLVDKLSKDLAVPAHQIRPAIWALASRGSVTLGWDGTLALTRD